MSTNNLHAHDASAANNEIDLVRLLGELLDHRKFILILTALFTLVAQLYALFATPVYQADALIQVEQKQGNALLSNLSAWHRRYPYAQSSPCCGPGAKADADRRREGPLSAGRR